MTADFPEPSRLGAGAGDASERWPSRVAILGVGLLGGSVALALRRRRPEIEIVGLVRSPATAQQAVARGAIDRAVSDVAEACRDAEVIVIATPVDRIADLVLEAARHAPSTCLITDVGSTKASIVEAVAADPPAAARFVAAHPIAGGEKAGVEHASESLLDGRLVVLTPTEETPTVGVAPASADGSLPTDSSSQLDRAAAFWQLTGARVVRMTPAEHDAHLASTSHVPHLVAAAVARLVTPACRPLVGTGWLDATRIAAGDPALWSAIVAENRPAILRQLERVRGDLEELARLISAGSDDELTRWLAEAKRIRDDAAL